MSTPVLAPTAVVAGWRCSRRGRRRARPDCAGSRRAAPPRARVPRSSTTTRSLCSITKPALCSTSSTAQPVSSRTAWICSPSRSASVSSSPDAGSSSSRSCGSSTIARANSTMRAMPIGSEPASSLADRGEAAALEHLVDALAPVASRGDGGSGSRRGRRGSRRHRRATRARRARCPRRVSHPKVCTRWNVRRRPRRARSRRRLRR